MADLSYRFDPLTEKHYAWHLAELREVAKELTLPSTVSVEIGSNRANFLRDLSLAHAERFHIGLEWREKYVQMGLENLKAHDVDNALLLQADANYALPILFDDGQIGELFILFPDPWWKLRHRKRRIIQPPMLDLLEKKMSSGAVLWIRTDVGPLADDMREVLAEHGAFEPLPFEDYPTVPFPRTTREVHIIKKGLPIHLLYFRRV
ncbi:MAG: tRNA (guanine(46)-N(7))-methyltransferase TrmB [Bradymonadaceae bacterium]